MSKKRNEISKRIELKPEELEEENILLRQENRELLDKLAKAIAAISSAVGASRAAEASSDGLIKSLDDLIDYMAETIKKQDEFIGQWRGLVWKVAVDNQENARAIKALELKQNAQKKILDDNLVRANKSRAKLATERRDMAQKLLREQPYGRTAELAYKMADKCKISDEYAKKVISREKQAMKKLPSN